MLTAKLLFLIFIVFFVLGCTAWFFSPIGTYIKVYILNQKLKLQEKLKSKDDEKPLY